MAGASLGGGFADPAIDAARAFRAVLEAMARPGLIARVAGAAPPAPLSVAAGTVLLTLCDRETPLHLAGAADCPEVRDWIGFHCAAPLVGRRACRFALGNWADLLPLADYPVGTAEYPDRSATLIAELPALRPEGAVLRGPGIRDSARLSLPEVAAFRANHALSPLGLDFILTWGDAVAALPRSTEVS